MKVVRVTSKGQATIPKEIREHARISAPGQVAYRVDEDGRVVVEPVLSIRELGALARSMRKRGPSARRLLDEERRLEGRSEERSRRRRSP